MPSKADTPLTTTYRPELDVSRELNEVDAAYYQSLIGNFEVDSGPGAS